MKIIKTKSTAKIWTQFLLIMKNRKIFVLNIVVNSEYINVNTENLPC